MMSPGVCTLDEPFTKGKKVETGKKVHSFFKEPFIYAVFSLTPPLFRFSLISPSAGRAPDPDFFPHN